MKRIDLIRKLEQAGCEFLRHGSHHDIYWNPLTGVWQAVPRHREVKEALAKKIVKTLTAIAGDAE